MALNLTMPGDDQTELKPRITVFGVGGAGGNAVNNMIAKDLQGVEFVTANTDAQALQQSRAAAKIQMGVKVTEGLGAGAKASIGAAAAEETIEEIVDHLAGAHMCFITAGMGGGTGTGAAPIIAQAARELGVLTVGVVTKPFQFEGGKRMRQAEEGVEKLQRVVDTLIIIPNQNLFRLANEKTTFTEAFSLADDVLYQGVKGVTDLMVRPGLINLDFADVRAVMDEMGKAMMGTGEAEGEERAIQAAEKAIANPLLDEISLRGAKGVLINVTGGHDLTLFELDEAANRIREEVDPDANIIVGSTLDAEMEGRMRVSVVATGIDATEAERDMPVPRRRMSEPLTPEAPAPEPVMPAAVTPEPLAPELQMPAPGMPGAPAPQMPEIAAAVPPEPAPGYAGGAAGYGARHAEEAPSLFDAGAAGTRSGTRAAEADGLPPPAYRPEVAAADEQQAQARGAVTPEAMARLRSAVGNARPEAGPAPAAAAGPERGRFGIGSLINRMSGHGAATGGQVGSNGSGTVPERAPVPRPAAAGPAPRPAEARAEPHLRRDPRFDRGSASGYEEEPAPGSEQERIEIPAFLRRQAN